MTADDRRRLHDALDAAADGPVDDAWDAIRARVESAEAVPASPRGNVRGLAVAAAVVVVAGGVALAARDTPAPTPRADDDTAWCAVLDRPARADVGVVVIVDPEATDEEVEALEVALVADERTDEVAFVDREAAYAEAVRLFRDQPTMLDVLRPEDVPTSFRVTVADDADARALVTELADHEAVLDAEVEVDFLRGVFARIALLARSGHSSSIASRPVDPEVVDALVATTPDDLAGPVAAIAPVLREGPTLDTEPSPDAATVLAAAEERCGLSRDDVLEPGLSDGTAATTTPTAETQPVGPTVPGAEATGWVVPEGLPAGWAVESITVDGRPRRCGPDEPQTGVQWVDPQGASVRVSLERCPADVPEVGDGEADTVDLGDGTTGTFLADDLLAWPGPDGGTMTIEGRGPDRDTLVTLGRTVVAGRDVAGLGLSTSTPAGWTELDHWMVRPSWRSIEVRFATPGGNRVGYTIAQGGNGRGRGALLRLPEVLAPGGLAFASVRQGETHRWDVHAVAPGVAIDVSITVDLPVGDGGGPEDEAEVLAAALRPADLDGWRAFLAGAPGGTTGPVAAAEAPADLGLGG